MIPIAMKLVSLQRQAFHVGFGDLDTGWIVVLVQLRLDAKPLAGSGPSDEVDDRLEARERFPPPVLCDVAEEPVFDLVPLARAWRKVTDMDPEPCLVGEILEFAFPSTRGGNAQMWKQP